MYFAPKGGTPGAVKVLTPGSNNDALVRCVTNPAVITFASLGNVQAQRAKGMAIKALTLDGVEPTAETVANKRYGIRRTLFLVTKGAPAGDIKGFIDFMASAEGQKLVVDKEFIPLGQ
jgi:phosphate transport system substrate-binding protein